MAPNPNPSRITAAQWWLWEQLQLLEPTTQLGGFYANKSGYHNTRKANIASWPNNYSIRDAEDRGGPDDKSAAIDWTFPSAQRGDYTMIAKYCQRLMISGKDRNDPRLDGWREWYGQIDSDLAVEGWDCRYLQEITSDGSHLWHIHAAEDRDKVESFHNKDAFLSVLRGEPLSDWAVRTATPVVLPVPAPQPTTPTKPTVLIPYFRNGSRELFYRPGNLMAGTDVQFVQKWIGPRWMGKADGIAGPMFDAGVREYQKMRGLKRDGRVGRNTFRHMGVRWSG